MDEQQQVDLAFVEQIAGDYPTAPLPVPGNVTWVRKAPPLNVRARLHVWRLWVRQGRPRRRGVIIKTGTISSPGDGWWDLADWNFDGRYCDRNVPAVEFDLIGDRMILRAVCGWHLGDLVAAAAMSADQLTFRRIW